MFGLAGLVRRRADPPFAGEYVEAERDPERGAEAVVKVEHRNPEELTGPEEQTEPDADTANGHAGRNARIIQRRWWITSSRRIARTASSRQARNQQPKMAVARSTRRRRSTPAACNVPARWRPAGGRYPRRSSRCGRAVRVAPLAERVAGAFVVFEQCPPTEVLAGWREREFHAACAELSVGALDVGAVEEQVGVGEAIRNRTTRFIGTSRAEN